MRRRYVWNGRRFVAREDVCSDGAGRAPMVISDEPGFVSPIDRNWVEGRAARRAHEHRYGVRQIGNDWAGAAKPRWWGKG